MALNERNRLLDAKLQQSCQHLLERLREPKPDQVDTLTLHHTYSILASEPQTGQVHTSAIIDARGHSTWTLNGVSVSVSPVYECTCAVSSVEIEEGDDLEQVQWLTDVSDVLHEFTSLWSARWQKHANLEESHWSRVLQFAAAYMPKFDFDLPPITPEVRRYKPRAARGPDGWSKLDLLHMPMPFLRRWLDLLAEIQAGTREWSDQLLPVEGFVIALSKENSRLDANGFRPIVLFSMLYRTWAGLRARQLLRLLESRLDHEAFGFMPKREAAMS